MGVSLSFPTICGSFNPKLQLSAICESFHPRKIPAIRYKVLMDKTLYYFIIKATPSVLLIILKIENIKHKKFYSSLFPPSLPPSLPPFLLPFFIHSCKSFSMHMNTLHVHYDREGMGGANTHVVTHEHKRRFSWSGPLLGLMIFIIIAWIMLKQIPCVRMWMLVLPES